MTGFDGSTITQMFSPFYMMKVLYGLFNETDPESVLSS